MSDAIDEPGAELTRLAARLGRWEPSVGGLSRERVLFESGRASARREARLWAWRGAALGLALVSVVSVVGWRMESQGRARAETLLAERMPVPGAVLEERGLELREPEQVVLEPSSYLVLQRAVHEGEADRVSTGVRLDGGVGGLQLEEPESLRVRSSRVWLEL